MFTPTSNMTLTTSIGLPLQLNFIYLCQKKKKTSITSNYHSNLSRWDNKYIWLCGHMYNSTNTLQMRKYITWKQNEKLKFLLIPFDTTNSKRIHTHRKHGKPNMWVCAHINLSRQYTNSKTCWHDDITWFKSITILCRTDIIIQNIPT